MSKFDINRTDLYRHDEPEHFERTKKRLTEISECGMEETGIASFGYEGVMSGLYIEKVWSYSDDDFKITGVIRLEDTSLLWVYKWASKPMPYNRITGKIIQLEISRNMVRGKAEVISTLSNSIKIQHLFVSYPIAFCYNLIL